MILELHFVTSIRNFSGHCHVIFPYKEIISFFSCCHVTFPYMELLSFFSRFVQKVIVSCFSDSFAQKTTQQSNGSCNVTSDSQLLRNFFKKTDSSFLQTHMKHILWSKEYCVARHDHKMCFLHNCRCHILLIGIIEDLLQKLDAFCFNYQHVDCLYTLFKYRFSGENVIKSGQLFDKLQRAVLFNQQNRGVDRMPIIAKKGLFRKRYKKTLQSSFQETKLMQTSGSVFADRMKKVEKIKI